MQNPTDEQLKAFKNLFGEGASNPFTDLFNGNHKPEPPKPQTGADVLQDILNTLSRLL